MGYVFAHKPKNPNFTKKEFFKIAKMEPHETHNYIIKEYGRCEVNYFHFIMLDEIIPLSWFMMHPWIPEKYR